MKELSILFILIMFAAPAVVLADGKSDFSANCNKCHGGSAKTNTRRALMLKTAPNKLFLSASEMNKAEMIAIVENGKGKMPGFEKELTKEQITAIADYVKALRKK